MIDEKCLQTLRQVQLFTDLNEPEFEFLAARAVERKFDDGTLVFSEGGTCAGMYVVHSGNVRIFKSSAAGREQVLSIEGSGSSVAELPTFDGGPYPATAQALGATSLIFVAKQDFQALCLQHPEVALKVLRVVGSRLRRLVGIIEELSFTTVRSRLAALLVRLAKAEGKQTKEGMEIMLPANNQELAAQIGTVRELVSRNLSRFQSDGSIRIEGRSVFITDMKKLSAELEES